MNQLFHSGTACLAMLAIASTVAYATDVDSNVIDTTSFEQNAGDSLVQSSTTELSVPPLAHVDYPADRPSWLDDAPVLDGDENTWVVVTRPCDTERECQEKLATMRHAAVVSYIKSLVESDRFDFYPVNSEWIEERLVTKSYSGSLKQGDMEMLEQAVQLTFTPEIKNEIRSAWKKEVVRDRLGTMAFLAFIGTTLLICVSMFLCMLSRRAERIQGGDVAPVSPGTVAFASMLNPVGVEDVGQSNWRTASPQSCVPVGSQSFASSPVAQPAYSPGKSSSLACAPNSDAKPNIFFAPIICTAIYVITSPGGYFWPKWVWFGCLVIPLVSNWSRKNSQTAK